LFLKIKSPQRWISALEHGAVVFLYDPDSDVNEIKEFKEFARSALKRHIIAPYSLPDGENFTVIANFERMAIGAVQFCNETIVTEVLRFIKVNLSFLK
jgi:hypothetical protein